MRILVVEDQAKMANYIKNGLQASGYIVDVAMTANAAQSIAFDNEYDLIIMDVNLPDGNGMDASRFLRAEGVACPILMLTALSSTKDKISGLDAGADDYLSKPFDFEELQARVRALLRRQNKTQTSVLKISDLEMDLVRRIVKRSGTEITLTQKEFALLEYFLRNANRPLTRNQISEHVWGVDFDTSTNVIDVYVNMLRKKVDQGFEQKLIQTVIGHGYVLKGS